jgi:chromosome partitioning protein
MIKFVINTPKGGVGKSTTATNIALLLARSNFSVMAVDLAAGLLMSQALGSCHEFQEGSNSIIVRQEGQPIPQSFRGSSNYHYAVLDTDDSFTVASDLLLGSRSGWRVIAPVNPFDSVGLTRIPKEIRAVMLTTLLTPSQLRLSIVANMAHGGNVELGHSQLFEKLEENGIASLLSNIPLPHGQSFNQNPLLLLGDNNYSNELVNLLKNLEVPL